jgi:hypothetical protein
MFEREDWTLFRSPDTLGQKAGVPAYLIPRLVLKELADNALDACGRCTVGPAGDGWHAVEDDGGGIPGTDDDIARLFSINRPLASSKILRRPTRGALGNGLRVVAGAVLATRGGLRVSTGGRVLELLPCEDDGTTAAVRLGGWDGAGTRVEVRFGGCVRDTAPDFWAQEAIHLAGGESSYRGRSSPHWYSDSAWFELLRASGDLTAREVIAQLEGCAEPKAGQIAAAFRGRRAADLSRSEAAELLAAARGATRPVQPRRLGKCGRDLFPGWGHADWRGFLKLGSGDGGIRPEIPVSIEVWAECHNSPVLHARMSVNRTPITGEFTAWGHKTTLKVSGCRLHIAVPMGRRPVNVRINIDTPYMPITTDGKEPDAAPFQDAIAEAIGRAIGKAKRCSGPSVGPVRSKKQLIIDLIPPGAAKAGGDGRFRFGQRQLFYAIRPDFIAAIGEAPTWNYFCQVVTDYEEAIGTDIPMMYRDARGVIYHPHLGVEIPLGTLDVEDYARPAWLFNKVLYCEKEGFFPILRGMHWPEINDIALMTSKGFSSRAARDLIDMLAASDEPCDFFCIHDADAAGTMIYQTLQEATRARGARKVRIHNLGLEPAEAREMGLPVEPVVREDDNGSSLAVADYVPDADKEWLQSHRIELNAMTSPQLVAWLDRKFAPFRGKVIPPAEVMARRLDDDVRAILRERIVARILARANVDGLVGRAMERRAGEIAAASAKIVDTISAALGREPRRPWTGPVGSLARRIAKPRKS